MGSGMLSAIKSKMSNLFKQKSKILQRTLPKKDHQLIRSSLILHEMGSTQMRSHIFCLLVQRRLSMSLVILRPFLGILKSLWEKGKKVMKKKMQIQKRTSFLSIELLISLQSICSLIHIISRRLFDSKEYKKSLILRDFFLDILLFYF